MPERLAADQIIRAGTVHSMTGASYRALALRDGAVVAAAEDPKELRGLTDAATRVVDAGDLTVLPAFSDAHEHLMEASRNALLVPVDDAGSVAEMTRRLAAAAGTVPEPQWILTSISWHESALTEGRMPTAAEFDSAVADRPVVARRGGHLAVANTAALRAAGITTDTPDPPGGTIGHQPDGRLNGLLEGAAVYRVLAHAPEPSEQDLVVAIGTVTGQYAALGVGAVREALITPDELGLYQRAYEQDRLRVRVRPLLRVGPEDGVEDAVAAIRGLGIHSGFGDDWLRVWGLKVVMDGGVEGGALEEPYVGREDAGHLNWEPDALVEILVEAVRRGWRVATHTAGDRAVRTTLDVYERVTDAVGGLPPGTLVLEHALLVDPGQQERAVDLGVSVTVQHPLLWNMGAEMLDTWGPERTARVNPIDEWLAVGAELAVGTDIARPFNPLLNVWGMVTRGTRDAGVIGAEHTIDRDTAVQLYTGGSARLDRESDRRGALSPGYLADLAAYSADPLTVPADELPALTPTFTIVGGRAVHDPEGRLG